MTWDRDADLDYEPNPDDEREVDLADESELPSPPATLDPEEKIEDLDDDVPALDDDREE